MAASSCQTLWFLHLAAKARIDVVEYGDDADALMPKDDRAGPDHRDRRCGRGSWSPATRGGAIRKLVRHGPRALLHRQQPEQLT